MKTRIFGNPLDKTLSRFWYPDLDMCDKSPKDVDLLTHDINIITSPYKGDVLEAVKNTTKIACVSTNMAEETGVANLVLIGGNEEGAFASVINTDASAFMTIFATMESKNLFSYTNINRIQKVAIIGFGPVARTAKIVCEDAIKMPVEIFSRTGEKKPTPKMEFDRHTLVINTAPADAYEISAAHLISLDQTPTKNIGTVTNTRGIEFFVEQAKVQSYMIKEFFK